MSSNQVCVIDGDYADVNAVHSSLTQLIDVYKSKLRDDSCQFALLHSKDGSELYTSLLQSFGLSVASSSLDLDNTAATSASSSDTTVSTVKVQQQHRTTAGLYTTFICFVVSDFDANDRCFVKLEETQLKLSNFVSAHANSPPSPHRQQQHKRFMIFGWPVLHHCLTGGLPLTSAVDVERPLYCKLMSGCFVCFTGFRKENKHTVAYCIKLVHYMGGSVRKEYNKKITHLIVKSTLSTKYKTAYNIGRCHLLTEEWIIHAWKHRNQVDFNVNNEEFVSLAFFRFWCRTTF